MRLISWNVNGIRALHKKGFEGFVQKYNPDILCVQETKAHPEQVEPAILTPAGRKSYWSSARKKGYSGVATFVVQDPLSVDFGIGHEPYDSEGRFVITRHPGFTLYNIYFPNGGSGEERHRFKQEFLRDLAVHLKPRLEAGEKIIVTGDYNIAHREIDIFDPVRLAGESGFLPEERAWFDEFLALGFVDTFRHFYPDQKDRFTWWSFVTRGRVGNRGWRIDYFCVSKNLVPSLRAAAVMDEEEGSDHCPVLLELDPAL